MGNFRPFEQKMRDEGLPDLAIETFRHYYGLLESGDLGWMAESEIEAASDIADFEELGDCADAGAAALAQTVMIKLNGGLATSMGMTRAKSLIEIKPGLSFLDVIASQVRHVRAATQSSLPLVLMNSFRTREDSLAALVRHSLAVEGVPLDFVQHKIPRILSETSAPAEWAKNPDHEWCPPGHGDIYTALVTSGALDALRNTGHRYAFVSNADNLGATLDLGILGWFARERIPFAMEVTDRTRADRKGGHLARRRSDGQLVLREAAQCPPADLDAFQDIERHRLFNTNNIWLDLDVLAEVLEARNYVLGLPMIRNEKRTDPLDASSPLSIQLETAMGAAIGVFEGAQALRVPRSRFAPVKTTNDLLMVMSDAYELTEDHRVVRAAEASAELLVDLDPAYFQRIDQFEERFAYGVPSLVGCSSLRVRGDVHFAAGVRLTGDVELAQEGDEPLRVTEASWRVA